MSGNIKGALKKKLGLKGNTKPGDMISKMNSMKNTSKPLKKTGKFEGKSNKLGGGGRFKQLVAQGKSPALAASIGRKSLGKAKFQKLAAKGKKNA